MARRIRRNAVISLVVPSFVLGATAVLTPAATATPAPGTYAVRTEGNGPGVTTNGSGWEPNQAPPLNDGESTQPLNTRAWIWPRTGDGPLEVTQEGRGTVMRIPLEGGGRLVVELTPDEAGVLATTLTDIGG
jgi:hypothetical protein